MNVKKFEAPTMHLALEKAKVALGEDAIILSQKNIQKGGFLGMFTKKAVQIVAATDTNAKRPKKPKPSPQPKKQEKPVADIPKQEERVISEPALPDFTGTPKQSPVANQALQKTLQSISNEPAPVPKLEVVPPSAGEEKRLEQEQKKNQKLQRELEQLRNQQLQATSSEYAQFFPEALRELQGYLEEQEVDKKYVESLISSLLGKCYLQSNEVDYQTVEKWANQQLANDLSLFKFGGISFDKKYINIVGPTGVGKTTTIAKIAALTKIEYKKKVALITADTYRISAIEQLQKYAQLLQLPMEIVKSVDDFKEAKEKFADYDLVLVDTAGRNYRDSKYVEDLKGVIDFNEEVESFLVLSLTSKLSDMRAIYNQFSTIPIKQLIFTKTDETGNYGAMINLIMETQKGVSYLTNGQEVPDDIMEASRFTISDTLFKGGR